VYAVATPLEKVRFGEIKSHPVLPVRFMRRTFQPGEKLIKKGISTGSHL
jgi:hypothetical protein